MIRKTATLPCVLNVKKIIGNMYRRIRHGLLKTVGKSVFFIMGLMAG